MKSCPPPMIHLQAVFSVALLLLAPTLCTHIGYNLAARRAVISRVETVDGFHRSRPSRDGSRLHHLSMGSSPLSWLVDKQQQGYGQTCQRRAWLEWSVGERVLASWENLACFCARLLHLPGSDPAVSNQVAKSTPFSMPLHTLASTALLQQSQPGWQQA